MTKLQMLYNLKEKYPMFDFVDTTIERYAKQHTKNQVESFCERYAKYMETYGTM